MKPPVSKTKKALRILALIAVGFASVCLFKSCSKEDHVPSGTYSTVFIGPGVSYQMDVDNVIIDTEKKIVTVWAREDRNSLFLTETQLVGQTIFTRATFDCANLTVTILEQRAFGPLMQYSGSRVGSTEFSKPKSLMAGIMMFELCGDIPKSSTEPSTPAIEDPKEPAVTI